MDKIFWDELKENFEERLHCSIFSALIAELFLLVIMIIFEYNKPSPIDYFYLFSIITLILSTIYFSWLSFVKENPFELISFIVMSSILNFQGMYQAITDSEITILHWFSVGAFGAIQLFYYATFNLAYNRYKLRAIGELNSINPIFIRAYKWYQTYISIIKLEFFLYLIIVVIFIYDAAVDWTEFSIQSMIIGIIVLFFLISTSLLGYYSVIYI